MDNKVLENAGLIIGDVSRTKLVSCSIIRGYFGLKQEKYFCKLPYLRFNYLNIV